MATRVVKKELDEYQFSNSTNGEVGMLIIKNGEELGVYPHFEYGDNLDDNYLIELASEFEEE